MPPSFADHRPFLALILFFVVLAAMIVFRPRDR